MPADDDLRGFFARLLGSDAELSTAGWALRSRRVTCDRLGWQAMAETLSTAEKAFGSRA
jgi:hypothetical protein